MGNFVLGVLPREQQQTSIQIKMLEIGQSLGVTTKQEE